MDWFLDIDPPNNKLLFSGTYYDARRSHTLKRESASKGTPQRSERGRNSSPKRKNRPSVKRPIVAEPAIEFDLMPLEPDLSSAPPSPRQTTLLQDKPAEICDISDLVTAIREQRRSKMNLCTAIDYIVKTHIIANPDYAPVDWTDRSSAKNYLRRVDFLNWLRDYIYDREKPTNYSKPKLYSDILRNINDTYFNDNILPEFCTRALQLSSNH